MSTGSGSANTAVELGVIRDLSRKFIAVLSNGPILPPDAMIVLCGEDALPRLDVAVQRQIELRDWVERTKTQNYEPMIVLSGGKHEPPRW